MKYEIRETVIKGNTYMAIFDENGNRITEWVYYIYPDGLVRGECDYYIACNGEECAVYYKNGQKVSENFSRVCVRNSKETTFNENLGIVKFEMYDGTILAIEFKPVYPYKKEEFLDYTKLLN
ncbi:MAG: hypothetical protein ACP5G8_10035, partial [Athalassotoga sp.]